jgi:glutamate-ammonia-ligase adenylyltransferase
LLADQVADAYRLFRKLQHQIRLQGEERARAPHERVQKESESVKRLWSAVFA